MEHWGEVVIRPDGDVEYDPDRIGEQSARVVYQAWLEREERAAQRDAEASSTAIDRDALRTNVIAILTGLASETADVEGAADRILALVRPVEGITLTPEEAVRVQQWHACAARYMTNADDALAARLEASS